MRLWREKKLVVPTFYFTTDKEFLDWEVHLENFAEQMSTFSEIIIRNNLL